MTLETIDYNVVLLVFQSLGLAFGSGAAFVGSFLFFRSINDGELSEKEIGLLDVVGKMVWGGLLILVLSTLIIFLSDIETHIYSTVFWGQMTVIFVIVINAFIFYNKILSKLKLLIGSNLNNSGSFQKLIPYLFSSQGVLVVSWVWLIVLGSLIYAPFEYWVVLSVYLLTLIVSVLVAFAFRKNFFDN